MNWTRFADPAAALLYHIRVRHTAGELVYHRHQPLDEVHLLWHVDKGGPNTNLSVFFLNRASVQSVDNGVIMASYAGCGEEYDVMRVVFEPVLHACALVQSFDLSGGPAPPTPERPIFRGAAASFARDRLQPVDVMGDGGADSDGRLPSCTHDALSEHCGRCRSLQEDGYQSERLPLTRPPSHYHIRAVVFYYTGDMPALAMLEGLQGPLAKFGCNLCEYATHSLPRGTEHSWASIVPPARMRSLERLRTMARARHRSGTSSGIAYFSSMYPPLLHTPIEHRITPSPLHCLLGHVLKEFRRIEAFASVLDKEVIDGGWVLPGWDDHVKRRVSDYARQVENERVMRAGLAGCVIVANTARANLAAQVDAHSDEQTLSALRAICEEAEENRALVVKVLGEVDSWRPDDAALPRPFRDRVRRLLRALKIEQQPYHGGAFIGRYCVLLLHAGAAFADVLRPSIFTRHRDGAVQTFGDDTYANHTAAALSMFGRIHQLFSAARTLCSHEQIELAALTRRFGRAYPRWFPNDTLPPKFHAVTAHLSAFALANGSVGLYTEECGESMHVVMNRLGRTYGCMRDIGRRQQAMLVQQSLESNPAIPSHRPVTRMCTGCDGPLRNDDHDPTCDRYHHRYPVLFPSVCASVAVGHLRSMFFVVFCFFVFVLLFQGRQHRSGDAWHRPASSRQLRTQRACSRPPVC